MGRSSTIERRRARTSAAVGLALVTLPLGIAWAVAIALPWSAWTAIAVALCTVLIVRLVPTVGRLVDRIEVRDDAVRLRRLWSRRWIRRRPTDLVALVPWLGASRRAPRPVRRPRGYLLHFVDGAVAYFDATLFPGVERALHTLVREPHTGVSLPLEFAGFLLQRFDRLTGSRRAGCLYAYTEPHGTVCTVQLYRRQPPTTTEREFGFARRSFLAHWRHAHPHAPPPQPRTPPEPAAAPHTPPTLCAEFACPPETGSRTERLYLLGPLRTAGFAAVQLGTAEPGARFDVLCARVLRELREHLPIGPDHSTRNPRTSTK